MKEEPKDHGSWWAVAFFLLLIAMGLLHAATQSPRHTFWGQGPQNPQSTLKTMWNPSTTAATSTHIEVHQK